MLTKSGFHVYSAIACDPGQTTGLAWVRYGPDYENGRHYEWHSLTDHIEVWRMVCNRFDVVIVEQFNSAGPGTKYSGPVLQTIGGIESLCWNRGIEYVKTYPSRRLPYVERAAEMVGKDGDIHAKTALSHLLWWERNNLAEIS